MKLRLTHEKIKHTYSSRHIWRGQKFIKQVVDEWHWHDEHGFWEDWTGEYPTSQEAERALLLNVFADQIQMKPTFEIGDTS